MVWGVGLDWGWGCLGVNGGCLEVLWGFFKGCLRIFWDCLGVV